MSRRGFRGRLLRLGVTLTLAGSAIQLRGCDPAVRDSLLTGLETTAQALATTLVQSFFTALQNNDDSSSGGSGGLTTTSP